MVAYTPKATPREVARGLLPPSLVRFQRSEAGHLDRTMNNDVIAVADRGPVLTFLKFALSTHPARVGHSMCYHCLIRRRGKSAAATAYEPRELVADVHAGGISRRGVDLNARRRSGNLRVWVHDSSGNIERLGREIKRSLCELGNKFSTEVERVCRPDVHRAARAPGRSVHDDVPAGHVAVDRRRRGAGWRFTF